MSDKPKVSFCNCENCPYDHVCCSADAWSIFLHADEVKKYPHATLPNGQFVMASGADGYCVFYDKETKKCKTYDDRPAVCRNFVCTDQEERMKTLLERYQKVIQRMNAAFSGFAMSFIFPSDKHLMISSIIIKNLETGQETQMTPVQFFGSSEDDVKQKIVEMFNRPAKKENI